MSLRQWLAMFCFYAMYVLLGTSIFYSIEHNLETERRAVRLQERIEINGKFIIFMLQYLKQKNDFNIEETFDFFSELNVCIYKRKLLQ